MSDASIAAELRQKVAELSNGRVGPEAIDPKMPLLSSGYIDSLTAVMLLAHIDDTWGVDIDETELMGSANTLDAVASLIEQRRE